MRILWFVNVPFPAVCERLGTPFKGSGWWMTSLAEALERIPGVELGVVCFTPSARSQITFKSGSITYYVSPSVELAARLVQRLRSVPPLWRVGQALLHTFMSYRWRDVRQCHEMIRDFKPDVIHIHGAEDFYGLLVPQAGVPVVLSIQGILGECAKYLSEAMTLRQRLANIGSWRGALWLKLQTSRERDIFRSDAHFVGRTVWDRSHLKEINPAASYAECHEVQRPEFAGEPWKLACIERNTLYTTTSASPLKGTAVLIRAAHLLQAWGYPVRLRLGGEIGFRGLGKRLRAQMAGLDPQPEFLGYLSAAGLQQALLQAHVYVHPSFIDNSPNSLTEAQVVGTPCAASYTGGIPSLVSEGETGLLFPRGDAAVLAMKIKSILDDDALAQRLSKAARAEALRRHEPSAIGARMIAIYGDVIQSRQAQKDNRP